MAQLGVNIDHVATIRQARQTVEPDPVWAAAEAELGGADCITVHLRVDRRHISDRDVRLLRETVRGKLNMEMSLDEEIVAIALQIGPDQATLVPENRREITTEGGLDVRAAAKRTGKVARKLADAGVTVSAFVDPAAAQIRAARDAGCQAVELHTGRYANACLAATRRHNPGEQAASALAELREALAAGVDAGLTVHAGHGLTYQNVAPVAAMDGFGEFNIGHGIIARAVFVGLRDAVGEMKQLISSKAQAGTIRGG
ncbi:MAG: pyridoxine 5'-phosphate synthase [Phycisphaerae bacterium]|nr:pyridoxine 5'-phosphate synthase [Phycisphaerae bacterium]